MPQVPNDDNKRMALRLSAEEKALLTRAAALKRMSVTDLVLSASVPVAKDIIEKSERLELTERDSLKVLDILETPPQPNKKLLRAAFSMPKRQ